MSYEPIALGIYANSRPDAAYQRRLNERALYFVGRGEPRDNISPRYAG